MLLWPYPAGTVLVTVRRPTGPFTVSCAAGISSRQASIQGYKPAEVFVRDRWWYCAAKVQCDWLEPVGGGVYVWLVAFVGECGRWGGWGRKRGSVRF